MPVKTPVQPLLRLACERPALLSGVLMTPLLEASAGVPLQVRMLFQRLHPLEAAIPALVLDQGEPILDRNILPRRMGSSIKSLDAESLIVPSALPIHVYTRLLQGGEPIGRIREELGLPTFREVIAHGRACVEDIADWTVTGHFGADPDADVLYRTSLLSLNQRPPCAAMRIPEMLPVASVYEQQDGSVTRTSRAAGRDRDVREEHDDEA